MKKMMFNDRYGLTQAVISGRKTVTRRVVKDAWWPISKIEAEGKRGDIIHVIANNGKFVVERKCPYKIGEIVAVAQSYQELDNEWCRYHVGVHPAESPYSSCENMAGWNNKMFVRADLMPHQIQITDIRIERLQDISEEDCMKEGVYRDYGDTEFPPQEFYDYDWNKDNGFDTPREAFASLIDKVSGRGTWDRNPFVWRIEFELVK